jgi:hypothetical protein
LPSAASATSACPFARAECATSRSARSAVNADPDGTGGAIERAAWTSRSGASVSGEAGGAALLAADGALEGMADVIDGTVGETGSKARWRSLRTVSRASWWD